jgi:hypothetical protein
MLVLINMMNFESNYVCRKQIDNAHAGEVYTLHLIIRA